MRVSLNNDALVPMIPPRTGTLFQLLIDALPVDEATDAEVTIAQAIIAQDFEAINTEATNTEAINTEATSTEATSTEATSTEATNTKQENKDKENPDIPLPLPTQPKPNGNRKPTIRIHFMRHADGVHSNLRWQDDGITNGPRPWEVPNPPLSLVGYDQCRKMGDILRGLDKKITHILCSPLARALRTALVCFHDSFDRGIKVIAWAQLIEAGSYPCNVGDPIPVLREKMEGTPVELKYLHEGYERARNGAIDARLRARRVTKTLFKFCEAVAGIGGPESEMEDVEMLVVSHGQFLTELLFERPVFSYCEVKTFEFASAWHINRGASPHDLFETMESKANPSHLPARGRTPIDAHRY